MTTILTQGDIRINEVGEPQYREEELPALEGYIFEEN